MLYLLKSASFLGNKHPNQTRNLWQWLNIIFNSVDEERRKVYGADRTCAEWLLRNGASVKWTSAKEFLADYNELPPENIKLYIKEVDATDSSISHYGFPHFAGCKHIDKIILHKCGYLENEALPQLKPLKNTLKYLQISSCGNITEPGLNSLTELNNLEKLIIADLPYVKDKEGVLKTLSNTLTKCNITYN
ncbi:hypothetical protein ILUMI_05495 [Ignelater luminosus]|uniref:ATP synthase subunit s, mitochondrial n=1 Tax=Ignelater luminosus TaxID=2038154 RepID=A0A8K0DBU0_IGNLU|nr:hypothetical protein ILUMI_05495 [Ignelater luminosus]